MPFFWVKASLENPFYSIHTRTLDSLTKPPILAHERTLWLLLRHCGLPIWIFTTRYGSKSVCLFTSVEHGLRFYSLVIDSPYLGQIAPVAVFTAREGARGVYAGVFGRAVLTTLSIGLPRPFLLRAADIGPTVKTHCLFPPPLREPDGHATYTETRGDHGEMVRRLIRRAVLLRSDSRTHQPPKFRSSGSDRSLYNFRIRVRGRRGTRFRCERYARTRLWFGWVRL